MVYKSFQDAISAILPFVRKRLAYWGCHIADSGGQRTPATYRLVLLCICDAAHDVSISGGINLAIKAAFAISIR